MSTSALREALKETEQAIEDTRAQIGDLQQLLADLMKEKRGLEIGVARRNGQVRKLPDWPSMTRPDAVLRVLEEIGRPSTAGELAKLLDERGRPQDEPNFVSAALSTLKGRGRVIQPSPGRWSLPEQLGPEPDGETEAAESPQEALERPDEQP